MIISDGAENPLEAFFFAVMLLVITKLCLNSNVNRDYIQVSLVNYLAHFFLSQDTPGLILGGMLGDFVKGDLKKINIGEADGDNGDIIKGIELHRKIDVYTDAHSIFRSSKRLIHPERRRFSGIFIDIFYDHFLAINWLKYSEVTLSDFSKYVRKVLEDNQDFLSDCFNLSVAHMISQDWLTSYGDICGVENALVRVSNRCRRENNIQDGIEDLLFNYPRIESDFLKFFPDLIAYINHYQ